MLTTDPVWQPLKTTAVVAHEPELTFNMFASILEPVTDRMLEQPHQMSAARMAAWTNGSLEGWGIESNAEWLQFCVQLGAVIVPVGKNPADAGWKSPQ